MMRHETRACGEISVAHAEELIPCYQRISRTIFKISFPKSYPKSGDQPHIFRKFYSPAGTLWSPKIVGPVFGNTTVLNDNIIYYICHDNVQ